MGQLDCLYNQMSQGRPFITDTLSACIAFLDVTNEIGSSYSLRQMATKTPETTTSFEHLVRLLMGIADEAAKLIFDLRNGHLVEVHDKKPGDPVTVADFCSQYLIISNLRRVFPDIAILAEEDPAEVEEVGQKLQSVLADRLRVQPSDRPLTLPADLASIDVSECVVIIDPIDGTKHFVLDDLPGSIILLGVAYRAQAVAGIMYQLGTGAMVYGVRGGEVHGLGAASTEYSVPVQSNTLPVGDLVKSEGTPIRQCFPGYTFKTPAEIKALDGVKMLATDINWREPMDRMRAAVEPDFIVQTGGTGHKALLFLQGVVDVYAYPMPGPKFWDTCAPAAVASAAGRQLTDCRGREFRYPTPTELKANTEETAGLSGVEKDEYFRHRFGVMGSAVDGMAAMLGPIAADYGCPEHEMGWAH
ncbi:Inositol monophosphatase [Carpediemonas membranifera]|uniref:3'(2'),5'-bisphosphate nucleotidase n=1 Tax=Carpediemonas membranifera TaxID=201153 RepID=A0A8J6E2Q2_9EUKA|nr:Inositol monophosphatase [Carpediemonas membranifera]|eukprot:KAG9394958.1 Inositol monophosphatase [Carpediemonas membranifera]